MIKSLLILGIVLSNMNVVFASEQKAGKEMVMADKAVEVGNKICPVSNHNVVDMGGPLKVTYKGKVYNLCCSMCKKDFLADPAKFTKIAEDEVASQVQ